VSRVLLLLVPIMEFDGSRGCFYILPSCRSYWRVCIWRLLAATETVCSRIAPQYSYIDNIFNHDCPIRRSGAQRTNSMAVKGCRSFSACDRAHRAKPRSLAIAMATSVCNRGYQRPGARSRGAHRESRPRWRRLLQRDVAAEFHVHLQTRHFQPHFCRK
jgi:hypothetical protein